MIKLGDIAAYLCRRDNEHDQQIDIAQATAAAKGVLEYLSAKPYSMVSALLEEERKEFLAKAIGEHEKDAS